MVLNFSSENRLFKIRGSRKAHFADLTISDLNTRFFSDTFETEFLKFGLDNDSLIPK